MSSIPKLLLLPIVLLALVRVPFALAVVASEVDTFEGGTTENWTVGLGGTPSPAPPLNVASGGPAGPGDNFMQLTSLGGGGPGSKLSVINPSQWAGDFIAAGITAITMDVNNVGATDLDLRLLFADPAGGPPTNVALSTTAVHVPQGSGWISVVFPIAPADLTAELGTAIGALTNATEMRLFHNPAAAFGGPPLGPPAITAALGVDNLAAIAAPVGAVPEPTILGLLAIGLLAVVVIKARKKRAQPKSEALEPEPAESKNEPRQTPAA